MDVENVESFFFFNLNKISESKHGVKTAVVVADFAAGSSCYSDIRRSIEDKDVGVLVNNVGVIPEYPMYLTEVN